MTIDFSYRNVSIGELENLADEELYFLHGPCSPRSCPVCEIAAMILTERGHTDARWRMEEVWLDWEEDMGPGEAPLCQQWVDLTE